MKVYYDYQILRSQKLGGISRYYYDLIKTINNEKLAKVELGCLFSQNLYFEDYFNKRATGDIPNIVAKVIQVLNRLQVFIKMLGGYDIVHPTYYNPYILRMAKGKIVITVYDMIHEIFPENIAKSKKTIRHKKEMLHKSNHIIAISQNTKKDILRFYPDIPEQKISVIYIGSSFKPHTEYKKGYHLPEKYILFVGSRGNYKNFSRFYEASRRLLESDDKLYLVCIGGGTFSQSELDLIGNLKDRVMQKSADDEMLAYAYAHAQCFVFPSIYEGFGIPTLEAFACRCPVALSDSSSMPEVGGDAVLYFDPLDIDQMSKQIRRIVYDEALRNQLIEKGTQQLKNFEWKSIAQQVVNCYTDVINE
jgi:glycosyltransferase involved in cell wall biosynthesis